MLNIIFEDQNLLIINKPAGIHSVRLQSSGNPSIADKLYKIYPELEDVSNKPEDLGLVNRLDFSTSGCLIAAKDKKTWIHLKSLILSEKVDKEYLALVEGKFPEEKKVENYIGSNYKRSKKVKVFNEPPKKKFNSLKAKSEFKLIRFFPETNFSLINAKVFQGRRHQIRAHCSFLGHPLVGDSLYSANLDLEKYLKLQREFFLHAYSVKFLHPLNNKTVFLEAPIVDFDQSSFSLNNLELKLENISK